MHTFTAEVRVLCLNQGMVSLPPEQSTNGIKACQDCRCEEDVALIDMML